MRQTYVSPVVIDYGSIAEQTFVTPAASRKTGEPIGNFGPLPGGADGDYICDPDPSRQHTATQDGGKNFIVLQCDKFGEYSHGNGTGS